MQNLKLTSLNIEGDKHLSKVLKFLKREKANVVCLQEVFENNFEIFKSELDMNGEFFPTVNVISETPWAKNTSGLIGVGILTDKSLTPRFREIYYRGERNKVKEYIWRKPNSGGRVVGWVELIKGGIRFKIATTHFTWSDKGLATDLQRRDIKKLLRVLSGLGEFVLCGDFNAPRGDEIWSELSKRYKDNIPPEVQSTIDPKLHRNGALKLVVDGLFSTPEYVVRGVKVKSGVSDHQAVMGGVSYS